MVAAAAAPPLDERELSRYLSRVGDRWPVTEAWLGGARVADARGAGVQRERGEEYVVVLVSEAFDGIPWLERVYQAESLWDGAAMGARAAVHCYTAAEFARKREALPVVRSAVLRGVDLREPLGPQLTPLTAPRPADEAPYTGI